ncbi:caspase-14-like isoform X2 [Erpetoichthys calabaricus]|uniref:caspase-14-like isoform X2 n=1 Tax=Erpetoichthys calabaricus TaxID=27687 RepID=UPI0022343A29|nr:caspase-14-like isoform X2 [Erpetoichthys calabaricus]
MSDVHDLVLGIIDELTKDDFERFKFYLQNVKNEHGGTIKKYKIEDVKRNNLVEEMISHFTKERVIEKTKFVLEKIPRLDLAVKLPEVPSSGRIECPETTSKRKHGAECGDVSAAKQVQLSNPPDNGLQEQASEVDHTTSGLCKYDLQQMRRGLVLCVTKGREGSEEDLNNISKIFTKNRIDFARVINPKGEEFLPKIMAFRDEINNAREDTSCSFVVLMSHGNQDVIKGVDNDEVKLQNLFTLFNNEQCPKLQNKPKVFIIQACRGSIKDKGTRYIDDDTDFEKENVVRMLPTTSDTLVVYASMPGYVAIRNSVLGSRLITEMANIFETFSDRHHIVDLFTMVNERLVHNYNRKDLKSTMVLESTLTRALYLS